MLNIRTDRVINRLLYLTVLLAVIGTTAYGETTQLGALRQEIVAGAEPSLAEMQSAITATVFALTRRRLCPQLQARAMCGPLPAASECLSHCPAELKPS